MVLTTLAVPVVSIVYLIPLGRRFVAAGMGDSLVFFVMGFWLLNMVLLGAGCGLMLS